jgi:hypothetical protein
MTVTIPDLDHHLLDELAPPCDYQSMHRDDARAAEWILWFTCPCPPPYVLLCTGCKDTYFELSLVATCFTCNTVYRPAAHAVRLIEPINRRPT